MQISNNQHGMPNVQGKIKIFHTKAQRHKVFRRGNLLWLPSNEIIKNTYDKKENI